VSYGIYLYHHLVMHLVDKGSKYLGMTSKPIFFIVLALATWAFAEFVYRTYESRFLALKTRFAN
jgi:peptidoglycan/LPS O-acetylase OafA/YrhL